MTPQWSYQTAEDKLLGLQSNISKRVQRAKELAAGIPDVTVKEMAKLLPRIGIPLSRLDQLSVIHVAGTKGKGSTCSMCESILRAHGFRTGFFSGPDLLLHRERIRLDGNLISESRFAAAVQAVYTHIQDIIPPPPPKMMSTIIRHHMMWEEEGAAMPYYFMMMTLVAFLVFLEEKVDVAVIEVGLGGRNDPTNVLREVGVVGITSLGLDHTEVLGGTLAEIAAAKAGIMKPGCVAYTVRQPAPAQAVLHARAKMLQCPLWVVPALESFSFLGWQGALLAVDVPTYRLSAALAAQLAHAWMARSRGSESPGLFSQLPRATAHGLRHFRWPGRYQVVEHPRATFYIDCAHTDDSIRACRDWFLAVADRSSEKILMYSNSPLRAVDNQFLTLQGVFTTVMFVDPYLQQKQKLFGPVAREQFSKLHVNYVEIWRKTDTSTCLKVFQSVEEAVSVIEDRSEKPSVLVTGSFYLNGALLAMIDPDSILKC